MNLTGMNHTGIYRDDRLKVMKMILLKLDKWIYNWIALTSISSLLSFTISVHIWAAHAEFNIFNDITVFVFSIISTEWRYIKLSNCLHYVNRVGTFTGSKKFLYWNTSKILDRGVRFVAENFALIEYWLLGISRPENQIRP